MGSFIDLTGQRFGKLKIISTSDIKDSSGNYYWNCICDCGKYFTTSGRGMRIGATVSCGCEKIKRLQGKFIDITGNVYGKLKVVRLFEMHKTQGSKWECLCECGNTTYVLGSGLRRLDCPIRSCSSCANKLPDNTIAISILYNQYKKGAKSRGYSFELTRERFVKLTSSKCNYCGCEPKSEKYIGRKDFYIYNGIDRQDNECGYTLENSVSCCRTCNIAKHTMPQQEFLQWIERVYKHSILHEGVE